jgi:dCTP deaminase
MILNDKEITELCSVYPPMIESFVDAKLNYSMYDDFTSVPSYGLGSFSYDVRLARNFKVMKTRPHFIFNDSSKKHIDLTHSLPTVGLWDVYSDVCRITIPPHGFALGTTIERLNVPDDIYITCMAKSTLARCGLMAHVTPIENGWSGYVTIELSNMTSYPMIVPSEIGIMALIFNKGNKPLKTYNSDRSGKYQNQPQFPVEGKL